MTKTPEYCAVVTWEGPGEPIVLKVYGPDGEVTVPLLPKRALTLAQELLTAGVSAIKAATWDDMYGQALPERGAVCSVGPAEHPVVFPSRAEPTV